MRVTDNRAPVKKKRGQIWIYNAKNTKKGSLGYKKSRPYLIVNDPMTDASIVTIVPLSSYTGRIEGFQQLIKYEKLSVIHYENPISVKAEDLKSFASTLSTEEMQIMDTKLLTYYGLNRTSFVDIERIFVKTVTVDAVKFCIEHSNKGSIYLIFKDELAEAMGLREIDENSIPLINAYLNTLIGMKFVYGRSRSLASYKITTIETTKGGIAK